MKFFEAIGFVICLAFVPSCRGMVDDVQAFRDPYVSEIPLMPEGVLIEAYEILKNGEYLILYVGTIVNNEEAWSHNIVIWGRRYINGRMVLDYGFNITPAMHYDILSMHYGGSFFAGDFVEVFVHANSDAGFREGSACLLTCEGCKSFIIAPLPRITQDP